MTIRLLLADDQALVRGALAALLELEHDLEVVAQVGRGDEVLDAARASAADVALLDVEMPGLDGIQVAARLAAELPSCRSLIVTTFGRPGYLRRAMEAGASGFIVKDTPSGHWEIAGVPVPFDWGYFPQAEPAFPPDLVAQLIEKAGLPGILGNKHASGTTIIAELGEEHIRTGKPVCYTSVDSVFQIAAHETHFGLDRLYAVCEIAFSLTKPLNIGRVIARPFVGETAADFKRTGNRRDFAIAPPEPTLLDRLQQAGRQVYAIGKISDIYAARGVTHKIKASGNMVLFDKTLDAMEMAADGALVFTNFVDFDQEYGHRRDVPGYAAALEAFDRRLPEIISKMRPDDLLVLTADHGNDPTCKGTDHTREQVPILLFSPSLPRGEIGIRRTFADIGESIAHWLGIAPGPHGKSFL